MSRGFVDATTAQRQFAEVARRQQVYKDVQATVTEQEASQIGDSYSAAPWAEPGVHYSVTKAGANPQVAWKLYDMAANKVAQDTDVTKPKKKSWWEERVYGNLKTFSRWLFATTQTVPDLIQNAVSDMFDEGPEQGGTGPFASISGWWKSTSLGTMMADQDKAGSGFFASKELRELQGERARRYRGEINGHAFTVGRGIAQYVAPQDSIIHRVLSGTVDATINLLSDPTNAVGKGIKVYKISRNAFTVAPEVGRSAARLAVGIGDATDEVTWNSASVVNWLQTNKKFAAFRDALASEQSPAKIMQMYGDNLPPEIAMALAKETDPKKIEQLFVAAASRFGLSDVKDDLVATVFGNLTPGIVPENLRMYPGATKGMIRTWAETKPFGQRAIRWFQATPNNRMIINGTAEDRVNAVKNMRRAINQLGDRISPQRKDELMDMFVKAYSGGVKRNYSDAKMAYDEFVREALKAADVPDNVIEATIKGEKEIVDQLRARFIDAAGRHQDGGFMASLINAGFVDQDTLYQLMGSAADNPENLRFSSALAEIDLIDRVQVLPDFRRIRRLTQNPFWRKSLQRVYATKEGERTGAAAAVDFLQNEVWKTSALATFGYIMRNLFDGQLKLSLKYSGEAFPTLLGKDKQHIAPIFRDPLSYLNWVARRTGKGTILGNEFIIDPSEITADNADAAIKAHVDQMHRAVSASAQDQIGVLDNLNATGEFVTVSYAPETAEAFVTGVSQQLHHYTGSVIARMVMEGRTNAEILDFLSSPGGAEVRLNLLENLRSGLFFTNEKGVQFVDDAGRRAKIPVKVTNKREEDEVLNLLIDKRYREALNPFMEAGNENLRIAFLTGRSGTNTTDVIGDIDLDNMNMIPNRYGDEMERRIGSIFSADVGDKEEFWAISDIGINPTNGEKMYKVTKLDAEDAFLGADRRGSNALRLAIRESANAQTIPNWTIYENFEAAQENAKTAVETAVAGWRRINSWFFNNVSGKTMRRFEKDPIFRQFYYDVVDENIDLLSPAEAQKVLDNIASKAAEAGEDVEKWATKQTLRKLKQQAASNSTATGTAVQLNEYAGKMAGFRMGEVLFDAASKSNLEDALRVFAPFGAAWREVMQKYIKLLAEDPAAIVRAQRAYNGLTEANINGENGFFYKDPVTGEMMFTFPMSGPLMKLFSGGKLEGSMIAPVKRLTMGFNVMPSLGPVGQFSADQFFKTFGDTPQFDDLREILLPYGSPRPLADQFIPQWMQRAKEAWDGNKLNRDSIYATTYIDVLRALSTSGEYDLSTEEGKNRLLDDAAQQARFVVGFRAFSQFLGPTAGTAAFRIRTKAIEENFKGQDIYAGELVKAFNDLQSKNYDTAVGEFLRLYGEEAQLYISSKTRAEYGGLEATDEFSNFERSNGEFFNRYKEVAGYFAPKGSEFSFAAWDRQLKTGKRERLTDVEVLELAQNAIGSYKYRQLRLQMGSYPTEIQRGWLRQQRFLLAKQYPGFPAQAVFEVGRLEQMAARLRQAVQYPGVSALPVTQAITTYLDNRDAAIAAAQNAGLNLAQSKAAQPLRDWLLGKANELISQVPEFGRVFDRELAAEIED